MIYEVSMASWEKGLPEIGAGSGIYPRSRSSLNRPSDFSRNSYSLSDGPPQLLPLEVMWGGAMF